MSELRFSEVISKIAHELRSPLTSVKGFSATLVKRWDRFSDDQKLQFVQTIHTDAERMSRIISEVLELARLESGRLELHLAAAHLASVAERAGKQVGALEGAERVRLDIPDDLTAWADPDRLEQMLASLIENGIKYSEEGPVEVTARPGANGMVELQVTDRGQGIEAERVASVFEGPSPAGRRSQPSGTGLGLYLTRKLAEVQGGTISVDSAPGRGSTFTLALPAGQDA